MSVAPRPQPVDDHPEPVVHIGPHRLYQGDAYHIRPQLGWFDADVLDPPYQIDCSGAGHYRKRRPNFDRLVEQNLHQGFDMGIINPLLCGAAIVFANTNLLAELLAHLKGNFHRHALCIWQKTNPQPTANKHYRSDCEFWLHAWSPGYHPQGAPGDLLRVRRFSSPRGAARFDHPCPKPLDLMASIMANLSGQTICDSFMGTGSTGVAAIAAGKQFTGIEHNAQHFATACRRIEHAWAQRCQAQELAA
jgi:DNA methylase